MVKAFFISSVSHSASRLRMMLGFKGGTNEAPFPRDAKDGMGQDTRTVLSHSGKARTTQGKAPV